MRFKNRSKSLIWTTVIVSMFFFAIFFMDFFTNIEKFILSSEEGMYGDWPQELRFYSNIEYQVFTLKEVPYHHPYISTGGSTLLFSNPQTSVLSPVNLFLPFVSIYNFFIFHVIYHYIIAILGIVLIRKYFKLPYFAIFPMFFLFGFNGRILSNYYVGHSMYITYLYFPLFFYFYLCLFKKRKSVTLYAASTAFIMTMIFFGGGIYLICFIILFFLFDAFLIIINILRRGNFKNRPVQKVFHSIFPPIRNMTIIMIFFLLFSAVKLLPALHSYAKYDPFLWVEKVTGYKNTLFFLETFYQSGLGSSIPFKEIWREEAYNFIGIEASILAVISIFYLLFIAKNIVLKRLVIIGFVFSILSFRDIYYSLFGFLPIFRGVRVHSRAAFITIAVLALLVPVSINHILLRFKASRKLREITMLIVGLGIFLRLYTESKKWMVPSETQLTLNVALGGGNGGGIEQYFYMGLVISIISILGVAAFLIFQKRKPFNNLNF